MYVADFIIFPIKGIIIADFIFESFFTILSLFGYLHQIIISLPRCNNVISSRSFKDPK